MTTVSSTPKAWRRADVLVGSLVLNLLALALPFVILQVYDRIIPKQAVDTFEVLLAGLATVVVLEFLLRSARASILGWEAARFDHRVGLQAVDRVLHMDVQQFEGKTSGYFLDRIHALDRVQQFYSSEALLLAVDFPFVIIFLVTIYLIAGWLVVVPAFLLLVFLIVAAIAGTRLHNAISARQDMEERRQNFLIEVLQGIHTVKSMAMEAFMLRRYERLQKQSAESVFDLARINSVVQGVGATFSQLASVSFVGFGASSVVSGELSVGALAAGTMLSGRVLGPGLKAMGVWTQFQSVRLARKRVQELFALQQRQDGDAPLQTELRGEVELQDVCFRYGEKGKQIFDGLSLHVQPGEAVSITGRNGVGKSTLVKLLAGFLHPTEGDIRIDGKRLRDYRMSDLHAAIAVMPQHGILFEGTILENMTLYREGEAIEQAVELSRALGLEDTISKMPEGLDTRIAGAALDSLPEGVKQKIIMVRSLVGNTRMLLFDDANANLDLRNDASLLKLIQQMKGERTMVIVTHRPSYMRLCDRNFVIEGGRLRQVSIDELFGQRPAARPKGDA